MKSIKLFCTAILLITTFLGVAQDKKVAVVTFYADRNIDLSDVGLSGATVMAELLDDPTFNLQPMIEKFHEKFFKEYAGKLPFSLVPEATVTENMEYKNFEPEYRLGYEPSRYATIEGYHPITAHYGKKNVNGPISIFKDLDGIMYVYITFSLNKGFGVGGTATTKMQAHANLVLYTTDGKKVFDINENANSKKTGVMVGGMPVMKPEKLLPMCESALDRLMDDLDKKLKKIVKKSAKKL